MAFVFACQSSDFMDYGSGFYTEIAFVLFVLLNSCYNDSRDRVIDVSKVKNIPCLIILLTKCFLFL